MHHHHHHLTDLCARTAQLLLANGAESQLIVTSTTRLGLALGAERLECTLTVNSVVLSAEIDHQYVTSARRVPEHGVNMTTVAALQRMVLAAESGVIDCQQVEKILQHLPYPSYPRPLVALMVALSCACFARLAEADWHACGVTFCAAFLGMVVRQWLSARHFNPFIVFTVTAFASSIISGYAVQRGIGNNPHEMMAASVLLLVPGFPMVNSLSDALKGYINMGVGRWMLGTILTLSACLGITIALYALGMDGGVVLP